MHVRRILPRVRAEYRRAGILSDRHWNSASPTPRTALAETPRSVSERAYAEGIHNRSETHDSVVARKLSLTECHDHPHSALQD